MNRILECCLLGTRDPRGVSAGAAIAIAVAYLIENGPTFQPRAFLSHVARRCYEAETLLAEAYGEDLLLPAVHMKKGAKKKGGGKERERGSSKARRRASGEGRGGGGGDSEGERVPDTDSIHAFSSAIKSILSLVGRNLDRAGEEVMRKAYKHSGKKIHHPCQGFAFCSVLMSLLAMSSAESFEDALVSAISLGGDTDTVGAMVLSLSLSLSFSFSQIGRAHV